jgi:hypothetical protein
MNRTEDIEEFEGDDIEDQGIRHRT